MTTAIRMGAVWSAPTCVRNAASSTIENGAATSDPGTAASRHVNASPSGTLGDRLVDEDPGRSPDEQRREDGPAHESAGLAHREGELLRDHEGDEQAHARGSRILEHRCELIVAREHRQRQCHADEPEHHPAKR